MKFPFSFRAKTPADKLPEQKPNTPAVADAPTSPQAVAPQAPAVPVAPAASAATFTPAASSVTTVVGQMDGMAMSAEDIIAAYKIFLKRVPESMEVVTPRVGLSAERVLFDFMSSSEFTSRPEVANLVFAVGKKILDERAAKNPAPTPTTDTNPQSL